MSGRNLHYSPYHSASPPDQQLPLLNPYVTSLLLGIAVLAILQLSWARSPDSILGQLRILLGRLNEMASLVGQAGLRLGAPLMSPLKVLLGQEPSSILGALSVDMGFRVFTGKAGIPAGLGNYNNSCYQNSVIQGLSSLYSLPQFLNSVSSVSQEEAANRCTYQALLDTITTLNSPSSSGGVFWLPKILKPMSTWEQQDAQEYFSKILDQLDKEAIQASRKTKHSGLQVAAEDDADIPMTTAEDMPSGSSDILKNPLEGLIAQRVGCMTCGYSEGLSLIPFNCLTVPLGQNHLYDVRDCLDEYTELEFIRGVECPKCTLLSNQSRLKEILATLSSEKIKSTVAERLGAIELALGEHDFADSTLIKKCNIPKKNWVSTTKSKQTIIGRPPKDLVIHVNRSSFNENTGAQTKNYAQVQFPSVLDLGPWCVGSGSTMSSNSKDSVEAWSSNPNESMLSGKEDGSPSPWRYELRAAIVHYGRHEYGHYVCYRKYPPLQFQQDDEADSEDGHAKPEQFRGWWRLSDDKAVIADEEEVLNERGVFMLFYERTEAAYPESVGVADDIILDGSSAETEAATAILTGPTPEGEVPGLEVGRSETLENDITPDLQTSLHVPDKALVSEIDSSTTETDDEEEDRSGVEHDQSPNSPHPLLMRTAGSSGVLESNEETLSPNYKLISAV